MALKENSKRTLDIIATQKKRNATQAYKQTHPNASNKVATIEATKLLAKPEAQIYLQEHVNRAKTTVVELLNSEKDDIRLRSATEILDRNLGKSTQRIEQHTTGITLNIDLSSALQADNPLLDDKDIIEA